VSTGWPRRCSPTSASVPGIARMRTCIHDVEPSSSWCPQLMPTTSHTTLPHREPPPLARNAGQLLIVPRHHLDAVALPSSESCYATRRCPLFPLPLATPMLSSLRRMRNRASADVLCPILAVTCLDVDRLRFIHVHPLFLPHGSTKGCHCWGAISVAGQASFSPSPTHR